MRIATITLLILIILAGGGICLQIFLSRCESKWFGLILPTITLAYSLVAILGIAIYDGMSTAEIWGLIISSFLLTNIPTLILLVIYFACREKQKLKNQFDKMNVQDL